MFNIGDRVVINSKMGNNIIPIIGTIVERFAGRENYHNGDTELCYNGDAGGGSVKAVLSDIEINDKFKEVTIG